MMENKVLGLCFMDIPYKVFIGAWRTENGSLIIYGTSFIMVNTFGSDSENVPEEVREVREKFRELVRTL